MTGSTTFGGEILPPNPPGTNFVAIPGVGPTGQVANSGMTAFKIGPANNQAPAFFIFANLNGTISAWNPANANAMTQNAATVVATTQGAVYTGLAITPTTSTSPPTLYAANGTTGKIDVFDGTFTNEMSTGFVDPQLPAGAARPLQRRGHRRQDLCELRARGADRAAKCYGGHGSDCRF